MACPKKIESKKQVSAKADDNNMTVDPNNHVDIRRLEFERPKWRIWLKSMSCQAWLQVS